MSFFLKCILICLPGFAFSQSIEREVFASAGLATTIMDFTIGEPFTQTFATANTMISQGFHQTNLVHIGMEENSHDSMIYLYPNPTRQDFVITLSGISSPVELLIFDLQGNLVHEKHRVASNEKIDILQLAAGTYILKTIDLRGAELSHHLLVKL